MTARPVAAALVAGTISVGTTTVAAADDSWGNARPVAMSTPATRSDVGFSCKYPGKAQIRG